jgi:hypothetical protein
MAEETANALHVGVGVVATCIGVACSVYHCCCRVWRRLKGYTPTAAAGAVAAAGLMAAGQLSSVTTVGPPPNRGDAVADVGASRRDAFQEPGDCQSAAQPQCSFSSGPSDRHPSAQQRCFPASGTQTVRKIFYLFVKYSFRKILWYFHYRCTVCLIIS